MGVAPDRQMVLARPDNQVAYFASHIGKLSRVNRKKWQVDKSLDARKGPDDLAWVAAR